jgi:hypothetical protein
MSPGDVHEGPACEPEGPGPTTNRATNRPTCRDDNQVDIVAGQPALTSLRGR